MRRRDRAGPFHRVDQRREFARISGPASCTADRTRDPDRRFTRAPATTRPRYRRDSSPRRPIPSPPRASHRRQADGIDGADCRAGDVKRPALHYGLPTRLRRVVHAEPPEASGRRKSVSGIVPGLFRELGEHVDHVHRPDCRRLGPALLAELGALADPRPGSVRCRTPAPIAGSGWRVTISATNRRICRYRLAVRVPHWSRGSFAEMGIPEGPEQRGISPTWLSRSTGPPFETPRGSGGIVDVALGPSRHSRARIGRRGSRPRRGPSTPQGRVFGRRMEPPDERSK
jgi:hypothetical protein